MHAEKMVVENSLNFICKILQCIYLIFYFIYILWGHKIHLHFR